MKKQKNGKLTNDEFARFAEILSDKSNYDKLDITTGAIFNKSKSLLKTLAINATKTGPTVKASRDAKNGFGIELKFKDKKERFLAIDDVRSWSGLKSLATKPEQKIAVEEYLKKIVDLNRDELNENQQKIYDDAKLHLGKIEMLRNALATYSEVVSERKQEKTSWFARRKKTEALPPVIDSPTSETEEPNESAETEKNQPAPTAFDTLMEELRKQRKEPSAEELNQPKKKAKTEPVQEGPEVE